ncbi:MAG: leucine-rich repeat domain-containing protein, partial [Bacteroidales bacterium]|nr:leucine-rich repeat domain-containing protein [Bacteroidales bacterium]
MKICTLAKFLTLTALTTFFIVIGKQTATAQTQSVDMSGQKIKYIVEQKTMSAGKLQSLIANGVNGNIPAGGFSDAWTGKGAVINFKVKIILPRTFEDAMPFGYNPDTDRQRVRVGAGALDFIIKDKDGNSMSYYANGQSWDGVTARHLSTGINVAEGRTAAPNFIDFFVSGLAGYLITSLSVQPFTEFEATSGGSFWSGTAGFRPGDTGVLFEFPVFVTDTVGFQLCINTNNTRYGCPSYGIHQQTVGCPGRYALIANFIDNSTGANFSNSETNRSDFFMDHTGVMDVSMAYNELICGGIILADIDDLDPPDIDTISLTLSESDLCEGSFDSIRALVISNYTHASLKWEIMTTPPLDITAHVIHSGSNVYAIASTVFPTSETYMVRITDEIKNTSDTATFTIHPKPSAPIISVVTDTVHQGETAMFSAISTSSVVLHFYSNIFPTMSAVSGDIVSIPTASLSPDSYSFNVYAISAMGCFSDTVSDNIVVVISEECSVIAYGTTGDLTWELCTDSTLTISGSGVMPNYTVTGPWYAYRNSIKTVIIDDGVTSIGNYAFLGYSSLTSVTIPNGVTLIGMSAFGSCTNLTSVVIPGSVIFIGQNAFSSTGLTSLTMPNSVVFIGVAAFFGCTNLTSITIPGSVAVIGHTAFGGCTDLTFIEVEASNP